MNQYLVSARKYRPQRFNEVVGQQHVTDTLKNALKSGHLAHAFLFCGPRGVGKTTCARILGKTLNCQNRTEDFEPCNECEFCKAMNRNASFNIIEQDAASNNSVNDIRDLIVHVNSPPPKGDYKVFIIDEVHMLSQSAFNAFLKTLEEPPEHAIFILATTEKHKILPTILSRCQIYDFKPIEVPVMRDYLMEICEKEEIEFEKDALHLIAQKAGGALRDALSLFDRIGSAAEGKVTYEAVIQNLNILDYDYFFKLTDLLLQQDMGGVLNLFHEILRKGFEPDQVIVGYSQHLRDLLISRGEGTVHLLEVSEGIKQKYLKQAASVDRSFLLSALQICNECDVSYVRAKNKRLHVEMALLKMTYIKSVQYVHPAVDSQEAHVKKKVSESSSVEESPPEPDPEPEQSESPGSPVENDVEKDQAVHDDARVEDAKESEEEPSPAEKKDSSSPPKVDAGEKAEEKPEKESPASQKKTRRKSTRFSAPSLKSLDAIEDEIEDKKNRSREEKADWEEEQVQDFFKKLSETANPPSTRSVLKKTEVHLKDGKLILRVGSTVDKSTLLQETWIIQEVRDYFHKPKLQIHIEIDEEKRKQEAEKSRPVSKKEVLDQMIQENPIIDKLREMLSLRFDK